MTTKELRYELSAVRAPGSKQEIKKFSDELIEAQERVQKSVPKLKVQRDPSVTREIQQFSKELMDAYKFIEKNSPKLSVEAADSKQAVKALEKTEAAKEAVLRKAKDRLASMTRAAQRDQLMTTKKFNDMIIEEAKRTERELARIEKRQTKIVEIESRNRSAFRRWGRAISGRRNEIGRGLGRFGRQIGGDIGGYMKNAGDLIDNDDIARALGNSNVIRGAKFAGKIGGTIGSALAAAALAKMGTDLARGLASGEGMNFKSGSMSARAFEWIGDKTLGFSMEADKYLGDDSEASKARKSQEKSVEMEKQLVAIKEKRLELDALIGAKVSEQLSIQMKMYEILSTNADRSLALMEGDEKRVEIGNRIAATQARINKLKEEQGKLGSWQDAEAAANMKEQEWLARRQLELVKMRMDAEAEIARKKEESARKSLEAAKSELDSVKERISTERDSLMDKRVAFGLKSREEQNELLGLLEKARGGAQLDSAQLNKLRGIGSDEADRIVRQQALRRVNQIDSFGAESDAVKQISQQLAALADRELKIRNNARNEYDYRFRPDAGNRDGKRGEVGLEVVGKKFSSREQAALDQIAREREALRGRQQGIYGDVQEAASRQRRLRGSLFAGEEQELAGLARRRTQVQANIESRIEVVAKFDQTAEQLARVAEKIFGQRLIELERRFGKSLGEVVKDVTDLQNIRRGTIPGGRRR